MADTELLPWVAGRLREWFHELDGRALAVSWGEVTQDIKPRLPIATVVPGRQTFAHNGGNRLTVTERFGIEFWLEPARVKNGDGTETPFWSYYDFNAFRDRLFNKLGGERAPNGGKISFAEMEVEADEYALTISFSMVATYDICVSDEPEVGDGLPVEIAFTLK